MSPLSSNRTRCVDNSVPSPSGEPVEEPWSLTSAPTNAGLTGLVANISPFSSNAIIDITPFSSTSSVPYAELIIPVVISELKSSTT